MATLDVRKSNTIAFTSSAVPYTVVAVPSGGPDMTFRIGGLVNPTLVVPVGATVRVKFINADNDEAHGGEVTSARSPFPFHIGKAALSGAFARALCDPTSAGDGAETITFATGHSARYRYVCSMPGHAQMGMHGAGPGRKPERLHRSCRLPRAPTNQPGTSPPVTSSTSEPISARRTTTVIGTYYTYLGCPPLSVNTSRALIASTLYGSAPVSPHLGVPTSSPMAPSSRAAEWVTSSSSERGRR